MPRRDTLAYLQAIRGAGNRSIECRMGALAVGKTMLCRSRSPFCSIRFE